MNRPTSLAAVAGTGLLLLLSGCASTGDEPVAEAEPAIEPTTEAAAEDVSATIDMEEVVRGREQLIRAFDAAWVRVIASGKQREILDSEPADNPGMANSYIVRMADCLPLPELTPYPEEPVGLLKQVIETGTMRRLVQDVPSSKASSSYFFSSVSQRLFQAMLDEMGAHYGVTITYTDVAAAPGRLASTSFLVDDEVDIVSQLNATGGRTQNMRRRTARRFTCTITAATQFIHIPESSPLAEDINSLHDLMDRPDVRICAGPLSTQTVKAFMPGHTVTTRYISDIGECHNRIQAGKADVMVNPVPYMTMADLDGYKSVHTLIVAGTPLWVAKEGIACDIAPARDAGEPECREIDPL